MEGNRATLGKGSSYIWKGIAPVLLIGSNLTDVPLVARAAVSQLNDGESIVSVLKTQQYCFFKYILALSYLL